MEQAAEREDLVQILRGSNIPVSGDHIEQAYGLLQRLKGKGGATLVLGYNNSMKRYVGPMDENVFEEPVSLYSPDMISKLEKSLQYDGAVLINDRPVPEAVSSGMFLRVDPIYVLEQMGIPNSRPLPIRFGFKEKNGTRHCTAIAASYMMPGTTVLVLSEENGMARIFERGRIIYSPIAEEIYAPKKINVIKVSPQGKIAA